MFDTQLRKLVDRPLQYVAIRVARAGLSANSLTYSGALVALAAALAILGNHMPLALGLIAASRTLDGLDGAVARINGPTAWGGYLDSLADYVFYISIPVAFGLANGANLVPALLLVASFTITAVSFLAFAAIAALQAQSETGLDRKAFLYSTGLMEGGETIAFFALFCLFPTYFPMLANAFALLCLLTVAQRLVMAAQRFK
ncbi:CDP-alcohol phosphatidyltransferase family protein [Sphingorhabdus sp. IMCC26285]|jgi:phosphatidylglycerophosphate synthase|uniref:CDP-alcohol phosphatidyltransferase family protein n=1 Tax=Sphingorhabdus profundilacus TaxID=2509718 RepID=A0A6I4M348_9SPHN|nr:CDP-alcohol phosphatidyltransferase family protein [Sphingorhabdus profundilacus]MVZ98390.1 CDP-alcohol phosphatidyltransferase family protein [Sphingorhabdus profundilacus]